jgi:hypothetical protein
MNETVINIGMYLTYALVAIAVLAAVIFPIFFFLQNFRKAKGTLLGLAVLLVILVISYLISSNEAYEAMNVGPTESQLVGGGITATVILIGLGLLSAIFTEIYKFFR